jgi:hypothetical protein
MADISTTEALVAAGLPGRLFGNLLTEPIGAYTFGVIAPGRNRLWLMATIDSAMWMVDLKEPPVATGLNGYVLNQGEWELCKQLAVPWQSPAGPKST